jgi:hypothetical protein
VVSNILLSTHCDGWVDIEMHCPRPAQGIDQIRMTRDMSQGTCMRTASGAGHEIGRGRGQGREGRVGPE